MNGFVPTRCQDRAQDEILSGFRPGGRWLLTGSAGTGKTSLMASVAQVFARHRKTVAAAPTHKAAAVLRDKLRAAGLDVECVTIHSLLGLYPVADKAGTRLVRRKGAKTPDVDVVIVDECSMLDAQLIHHIDRWLRHAFVLYVGDPAQLPPVGEARSGSFETLRRSHLETIVRQEADNPVLTAAHVIRASQGGPMDWSWVKPAKAPPRGVFLPGRDADKWLHKAFTSPEFQADNDRFRYLCYTNARVAQVNARVRRWLYGDTPEPFSAGERVLIRQPVFVDDAQVFATNEEAPVEEIALDEFDHRIENRAWADGWTANVPSWRVVLRTQGGLRVPVHIPRGRVGADAVAEVEARLIAEAKNEPERWEDKRKFLGELARLQSVFALTVHCSQGSTFSNTFVDVDDIRRRAKTNTLETQQLLYVAATRPTTALILVGAGEAA